MKPKLLKVVSRKLNVSLGEKNWNVFNSFTFDPSVDKKRGSLFVLITATSEASGVELVSIQRTLVKLLYEQYYKNLTLTAFNALTNAVKIAEKEAVKTSSDVSIGAISYYNNTLYVAAFNASVLIYRDTSFSKIITANADVVSASGYPKRNDVLVIATDQFTNTYSESLLRNTFLTHTDEKVLLLHNTVDQLEKYANTKSHNLGACFLKFEEESESISEETDDALNSFEVDDFNKEIQTIHRVSPRENNEPFGGNIISQKSSFISQITPKLLFGLKNRVSKDKIVSFEDRSRMDSKTVKKKKLTLSIGLIITLLLLTSIVLGVWQKKKKDAVTLYEPRLMAAQHDFNEAMSLFSLSPERAREHFFLSQTVLDQLVQEKVDDERLINLTNELQINRGKILGEYIEESQGFVDLTLLSDNFHGDDLVASDEKVYVLDRVGRKLISVAIETKRSEVLAGPGAIDEEAFYIASSADRVYVSTKDGIYRVDEGKELVGEEDLTYADLPYSYAANLYIVDTANSEIIRYSAYEGGFSEGKSWLVASADPDLSKIKSLSIDGSIWMVSETGGIYKFSLGNQINFEVSGVFPQIENASQIFTTDELEYLYILEPSQKRVVVTNKEGVFVAQYISEKLTGAIDFAVSEKSKKVIFLTGDKLESIDLKHF
ncbi:hypothetical protein IPM62_00515 [Candidatus Woesebacteria bacterium]|nr:MAG: hypothetical protein IPM62_00515 [Candidatus Woesebacteria bacterium]